MATKVKMISAGIEALLKGAEGRAAVESRLSAVESAAIAGAPIDSGEYVGSIHAEWTTTDRIVGRVVADAPHALVVEADTGNLARALDAAG